MSDASLHSGRVISSGDATPLLRLLRVRPDDAALAAGYAVPGQYLKAQAAGGPVGTFALASAPGGRDWELLLKRGAPAADALSGLAEGAPVQLSAIIGKGFAVHEARGRDVLLFAVGSGIAPIRALAEAIAADRVGFGKVRLYEGQREPEHFGFAAQRAAWRAAGVETVEVLSRPHGNWNGRVGYVQTALLEDQLEWQAAVAYLCGMKGMVEAVRETLAKLGVPKERTHLNY